MLFLEMKDLILRFLIRPAGSFIIIWHLSHKRNKF